MISEQANDDRRQFERIPWECEARLMSISMQPTAQTARIHHVMGHDIGEGGVQISADALFGLHSRLLVEMTSPEIPEGIQAVGSVAWIAPMSSTERWLMGIEFSDVGDSAKERIRALLHDGALIRH